MAGPLSGIKVVEFGVWVAGPSAAGIMADWGAEVIKIEPPTGDPFRGLFAGLWDAEMNPPFELDNRGKKSLVLDLQHGEAQTIARNLVDGADVFLSNMRPRVLEKYGLGYDACAERNPGLIYCQVSGYGADTDEANRAAYDVGAFWSRAGVGISLVPPGNEPPQQRGGMGDHMTGMGAAGAISAALFNRERTGKGQRIGISLLRVGMYMMGWDLNTRLRFGYLAAPYARKNSVNPIINSFKAGDDKWFWLLLLQADRHWPDLLRAIERPDLGEDERFRDIPARLKNNELLVETLDAIFATRTREEWGEAFDRENVWFALVQTIDEVAEDPLAEQAGGYVDVNHADGPQRQVATPADFFGTPVEVGDWAPELGQHTEQVLVEMGYDWDAIIALKEAGAIP